MPGTRTPAGNLQGTTGNNGRLLAVVDSAGLGAGGLDGLDNLQASIVSDLAEDDVAAVQPVGDDGGDEELGAVGVGAGVGHGEQTGAGVLLLEVLVGELLAVDGLATSAVATGEVTTLKHEVGDDAVEGGAGIAEAVLASAELAEVAGGLGNDVIVEVEDDTALLDLHLPGGLVVGIEDGAFPLKIEVDGHVV
jgi:hypothetical protein